MAAILNSAIMDSAILHKRKLHSFILTQIDDGSHLEFCYLRFNHLHKKNFTCSFWLNLMMSAILNSAMLDSEASILDCETLLSSLRFIQKTLSLHSDSDWN